MGPTFMKSRKWEFKWYQPPPASMCIEVCYSHAQSHNHTLSQYTVHKHHIASQLLMKSNKMSNKMLSELNGHLCVCNL